MNILKEKVLLLAKVGCVALTMATAIVIIACNGDGKKLVDEPQENYSLVGEWYEVGAADDWGTIVTFTETNIN